MDKIHKLVTIHEARYKQLIKRENKLINIEEIIINNDKEEIPSYVLRDRIKNVLRGD